MPRYNKHLTTDPMFTLPASALDGHAGTPGKGPIGQTCGSCEHICELRGQGEHDGRVVKCELGKARWHTRNSAIKVKDRACEKWEVKRQA